MAYVTGLEEVRILGGRGGDEDGTGGGVFPGRGSRGRLL